MKQENSFLSTIFTRTSVRRFENKKIPEEHIELILRAAMAAPSSMNIQPWHFIVINEESLVRELCKILPYAKMLKESGTGIVVCGDISLYEKINQREKEDNTLYWVQDASAASENLLLAAHAIGLGAVWTGIYPLNSRIKIISERLSLPEHIIPLNLIVVGYPFPSKDKGKDKWDLAKVHYNKY